MKGVGPLALIEATETKRIEATETKQGLSALSHFHLAEAAFEGDDLAVAEDHARRAVEQDPAHLDAAILLAWVRGIGMASGASDDSIHTLSLMLSDDPSNEKARFYRAKLLARANRFPEALADFTALLGANPGHLEAQTELAALRAKLPTPD